MSRRNPTDENLKTIEEETLKRERLIKRLEKLTIKELAEKGQETRTETDIIKNVMEAKKLITIYEEKGFKGVYDWLEQKKFRSGEL